MNKNFIEKNVKKFSSNIFLIDENGHSVTYNRIFSKSSKKLNFIKEGDLCLILADNCLEYIELYLYFLKSNIKQILVDKNTNESQIKKISTLYKPNYLIVNNSNKTLLKNYKFIKSYGVYNIYLFSEKKIQINNDLALLLSTSGSTGSSRFVK